MTRSATLWRLRHIAYLALPLGAAGCGPATYGTGQAPEVAIFNEMSGGLLSRKEKPKIDYQPRAPLVLPSSTEQLPPPVESAQTANPDWPVDRDAEVAKATARAEDDDPFNDVNQAEYRRLKPLGAVFAGRGGPSAPTNSANQDNGKSDYYSEIVNGKSRREEFRKALADSKGYGRTTERRYLTDPPLAYRQAEGGEPGEPPPQPTRKKRNFFSRLFSPD